MDNTGTEFTIQEPAKPAHTRWFRLVFVVRLLSLLLIIAAGVITYQKLSEFKRQRIYLPSGSTIAGIPVGGLERQEAARRLQQAYSQPVELRYNGAVINLDPNKVGFQLDLEKMLPGDPVSEGPLFWQEFWKYLRNEPTATPFNTPLQASYSKEQLHAYLEDLARRYDQPPVAALPVAGTITFRPGISGYGLGVEEALPLIDQALVSLTRRQVNLPIHSIDPARPDFKNLQILLKQILTVSGFDGLTDIYMQDLQSGQQIHFALRQGQDIPVQPDIAYTASSIIKIPILVSLFRRIDGTPSPAVDQLIRQMINNSSNEAADALMKQVIDGVRGPLDVTEDMQALGLENTFMAGYFAIGSSLLEIFKTPANQRVDINTDPDIYSQTTPSDVGKLLVYIDQCAENGSGQLISTFPNEITQSECQAIVEYLKGDRLPYLISAGLPEGTSVAHKHGYGSFQGTIHSIGDAALVFSPGGNYVMAVYLDHPDQLIWDTANALVARLARAAYNYYNLPAPQPAP